MDPETNHQTDHQFRRLPKGERRVRFADTMGMELVSIFLFDLISNYYFASIHNHKQLPPPPPKTTITNHHNYNNHHNNHNHHHSSYNSNNKQNITDHSRSNQLQQNEQQISPLTAPRITRSINSSISYNNNSGSSSLINSNKTTNANSHLHQHHQNLKQQQQSLQNSNNCSSNESSSLYICDFTQPISLISFKERVKINKVHLETCNVDSKAGNISVSCTIRVLNQSYDKSVIVRYTTDEWHTHTDSLASYKPNSHDGWSDKFTSTFSVTGQVKSFRAGQRIIFAIRYACDGDKVYWDNNGGLNYVVKKF